MQAKLPACMACTGQGVGSVSIARNDSGVGDVYPEYKSIDPGPALFKKTRMRRFERVILPHLDACYNLARWLTGHPQDAEDVVQEAFLRAFRHFDDFSNSNATGWIMTIVRNTAYSWLRKNRGGAVTIEYNEEDYGRYQVPDEAAGRHDASPEQAAVTSFEREAVHAALEDVPLVFREALVLRELEGLSYREIADITGVPVGTVMSRLARGREQLLRALERYPGREGLR